MMPFADTEEASGTDLANHDEGVEINNTQLCVAELFFLFSDGKNVCVNVSKGIPMQGVHQYLTGATHIL